MRSSPKTDPAKPDLVNLEAIQIDQIIRTPRRTIALVIERDGRLVVRAPLKASNAQIRALVVQKAAWIAAKQAQAKARPPAPAEKQFVTGESFLFLGKSCPLEISTGPGRSLQWLDAKFQLAAAAQPASRRAFEAWYRAQAARILSERAAWYAGKYGFGYQKVRISGARTRWGSCSTTGTLSFTWRLVMAPLEVIDYVVVHELVHTQERNHARGFWEKVKAILPDYQERSSWLKKNSEQLRL